MRRLDGIWIALAFLALALLLGQDAFYKVDGQGIVRELATGQGSHPRHPLATPLLRIVGAPVHALGFDWFRAATVGSAAFAAIGLAIAHRAFTVCSPSRGQAITATLLVASAPSYLFFATVVEFHGVFVAFAAMCFLVATLAARKRSVRICLGLGLAIGGTALVHGTGHLLSPILGTYVALDSYRRTRSVRRAFALLIGIAGAHLAVLLTSIWLSPGGGSTQQVDWWAQFLEKAPRPTGFLEAIWLEWLRPCLFVSFLSVPLLLRRSERSLGAAVLVGLALLLTTTWILVPRGDERGAYLLPLLFLAAPMTAKWIPRRWLLAFCLVGLSIGVRDVLVHDTRTGMQSWEQRFEEVDRITRHDFVVLSGHIDEIDALARRVPDARVFVAADILQVLAREPQPTREAIVAGTLTIWAGISQSGARLLCTTSFRSQLESSPLGRPLMARLDAEWRRVPFAVAGIELLQPD